MNSPFYLGAAATSTLYALVLEAIGKEHYEPDYTVVTVAAGVALTGGWVALRLALAPLPNLQGRALAWWVWRQVLWMFVATGSPITIWQVWQSRQRIVGLLDYQVRTHYVHEARRAAALAAQRGGAA